MKTIWLQLYTLGHFVLIVLTVTVLNTKIVSLVFEVRFSLATNCFFHILRITCQFFILFIIIETVLIRYWTKFIWKSIQQINDKFVINFLTLFNSCLSLLLALYEFLPGIGSNHYYYLNDISGYLKLSKNIRYENIDITGAWR